MKCKNCNGIGVTFTNFLPISEEKCCVCGGLGTVERFLIETFMTIEGAERYLRKEPNEDYRLVSVTPKVVDGNTTYQLFWERNGK